MGRFDRYVLRQLLLAFGFFGLILVLVYWINRAVLMFDRLIANGQNARVFLELTVLTLPSMVAIVLPIAAFAASVFVTDRMASENELVVARSAGMSPWRIARPVAAFGLIAAAFLGVLEHVLVPLSQERLARREAEIAQNVTARFLAEGEFVHPADGITLYVREITRQGEMRDIFLSDTREDGREFVYSAKRALIVRAEGVPRLVMFDGLAQVLDKASERLTVTSFDDFTYDLASLAESGVLGRRRVSGMTTGELLRAGPGLAARLDVRPARIAFEIEARNARALLALVAALIGHAALVAASFSRFGLGRQIFLAVALLAAIKFLDNLAAARAMTAPGRAWLVYLPVLAGLALTAVLLWRAARLVLRPARRSRRAETQAWGETAP